ncbi:hypothetical protein UlMin_001095 [Ulmus minor]
MKTEIISRICIKPSSPTPPHLKTYKLCLLDQISTAIHGNMTFFFPAADLIADYSTKSLLLQQSISETLTRFYPLAGRFLDAATIDCNDDGVYFIEAVADGPLSEFLSQPNVEELDQLLPTTDPQTMEISNSALWLVKFTLYSCGGTAVSISLTHKIVDIATLLTLLKSWTAACRRDAEPCLPDLSAATILPPRDIPGLSGSVSLGAEEFVSRRFVFEAAEIANLKEKVVSLTGQDHHPSRVQVVLALIWKCAVAAEKSKTGSFKPTALFQAVNLRTRMDPPMPENSIGNFIWPFAVIIEEETDLELHIIVTKIREAMTGFLNDKANKFRGDEAFSTIMAALKERGEIFKTRPGLRAYVCSSWCKFPLFDTDFGWGKPVWMTSVNKLVSNTVVLKDTSSGGVDVLLTLNEEEMEILEKDPELLKYASVNPPIIVE